MTFTARRKITVRSRDNRRGTGRMSKDTNSGEVQTYPIPRHQDADLAACPPPSYPPHPPLPMTRPKGAPVEGRSGELARVAIRYDFSVTAGSLIDRLDKGRESANINGRLCWNRN